MTIGQAATRIGEPPRRVRHQIELLLEAGLIVVDSQTPKRNARERHYRALALPAVPGEVGLGWPEDHGRKVALSVVRTIVADLDVAVRERTFGSRSGHAVERIPGGIDEQGWEELVAEMLSTQWLVERAITLALTRLERDARAGIAVTSALLLFEAAPWETDEADRQGPYPTHWLAD